MCHAAPGLNRVSTGGTRRESRSGANATESCRRRASGHSTNHTVPRWPGRRAGGPSTRCTGVAARVHRSGMVTGTAASIGAPRYGLNSAAPRRPA